MAAIEPGLRAAASAIARPRSRTSVIASSRVIASAAASAANSPTEWPITKSALIPRSCRAASTAREVATSADCCTAVSTQLLGVGVEAEALQIEPGRRTPAPEDVHRGRHRFREVAAHARLDRSLAREAEGDLVHAGDPASVLESSASARFPR